MNQTAPNEWRNDSDCDKVLGELDAGKQAWTQTSVSERIALLEAIKENLLPVAQGWAETAARKKRIPPGSPLAGEEWLSGPYALMAACNGFLRTLSRMENKAFLDDLPRRPLPSGQLAIQVMPRTIWDRLLLSGISAEVWMLPEVTGQNLKQHAATAYDIPLEDRRGKVALVLGAGNIAAIAPLDCFQKLFVENQVVLLKMNPVNDYLTDYLDAALAPLIVRGALRILRGDGALGAYLSRHPLVEEIHITGSVVTHDAIVWGAGEEGAANKAAGRRINVRPITSELGAVCPTIVVPGPWSAADISFQAENIATQKLHNSGFNCIACQTLILPEGWDQTGALVEEVARVVARAGQRASYYPGAGERVALFEAKAGKVVKFDRGPDVPALSMAELDADNTDALSDMEAFAPALAVKRLKAEDAETYLRDAIAWANDNLYGTLGANILIHPKTIRLIGRDRFDRILAELRYGCIAVNGWAGLGFLLSAAPWGGFAGATLSDVQSGLGTVHNTYMLDHTERTIVQAPFAPFPRNLLSGDFSLLPRPPWFITNRKQAELGQLLTRFEYQPGWLKLPRLFLNALRG